MIFSLQILHLSSPMPIGKVTKIPKLSGKESIKFFQVEILQLWALILSETLSDLQPSFHLNFFLFLSTVSKIIDP